MCVRSRNLTFWLLIVYILLIYLGFFKKNIYIYTSTNLIHLPLNTITLKRQMKRIAAFTLYCLLIFPNIAQADNVIEFDDLLYAPDDSLRSKQLSGVEVMGEREWRENGIMN